MSEKIATREAYGKALVELGNQNDKVVVLETVVDKEQNVSVLLQIWW